MGDIIIRNTEEGKTVANCLIGSKLLSRKNAKLTAVQSVGDFPFCISKEGEFDDAMSEIEIKITDIVVSDVARLLSLCSGVEII